MKDDYKDKLMELVNRILSDITNNLTEEDKSKFVGVGPMSMMVSAHMVYLAQNYTKEDLAEVSAIAYRLALGILDEWDIDVEVEEDIKPAQGQQPKKKEFLN